MWVELWWEISIINSYRLSFWLYCDLDVIFLDCVDELESPGSNMRFKHLKNGNITPLSSSVATRSQERNNTVGSEYTYECVEGTYLAQTEVKQILSVLWKYTIILLFFNVISIIKNFQQNHTILTNFSGVYCGEDQKWKYNRTDLYCHSGNILILQYLLSAYYIAW